MPPSPSESQPPSRSQSKDPPDKAPAPSHPTIQIRTPTNEQPPAALGEKLLSRPAATSPAPARPPFSPFFTLITDTTTGAIHHPRNIHYLFSSDDPSILTSACLTALEDAPSPVPAAKQHTTSSTSSSTTTSRSPSSSTATHPNPSLKQIGQPSQAGQRTEERILILDLDTSGTSITKASSLSSSWQIISTNLAPAPTWAESPSDAQPSDESTPNFMLRIVGTDGRNGSGNVGMGMEVGGEAFENLMREFDERMRLLRTVVESGVEDDEDGDEAEKDV